MILLEMHLVKKIQLCSLHQKLEHKLTIIIKVSQCYTMTWLMIAFHI